MPERKAIVVAGLEITEEWFPHLYRIAKIRPEMLEAQLRYFSRIENPTQADLWIAAINFESDLAHG